MNIGQKTPYAEQAIRSISDHTDVAPDVRRAALANLKTFIDGELERIDGQVAAEMIEQGLAQAPAEA